MKKKSYKWLFRLIDKITNKDCPNNNHFIYYGHNVDLTSGTRDYVSCYVSKSDLSRRSVPIIDFSFDFWTKELVFDFYTDYEIRNAVFHAFKSLYDGDVSVVDEPIKEDIRWYSQEDIREEFGDEHCEKRIAELESKMI